MILEDEIFDPELRSITDGEVMNADGSPMKLYTVIQRRWGWPKAAARAAAAALHKAANGSAIEVHVHGSARERQQMVLFRDNPGLQSTLLEGWARGASREAESDTYVQGVSLCLSEPIQDFGLVTELMQALCWRLGVRLHQLRDRSRFTRAGDNLTVHVDMRGIEE